MQTAAAKLYRTHDIAPAMRKILKPWHRVQIPELQASTDGLAEIGRVVLLLVIRNQMFLKAVEIAGVGRNAAGIAKFLDAHEALVANLSLLRSSQVGPYEVPDLLANAREASDHLADMRADVLAGLDAEAAKRVMDAEWKVAISTNDVRDEIDRASALLLEAADVALGSDWLSSSLPTKNED